MKFNNTKRPDRFYIYVHYRNDNGNPFYIGRGSQNEKAASNEVFYGRAYNGHNRTKLWNRVVRKHGYTVDILVDCLTLAQAKEKEKEFIALYGRFKQGGLLVNFKNGGEDDATDYRHDKETIERFSSKIRKSIEHNIETYVAYEAISGCWLWMGQFSDGFPKINQNGHTIQATRAIYQHERKITLKPKSEVLHNTCGCRYCVNPSHYKVDVACPIHKQTRTLSENQVIEIIHLFGTTDLSNTKIAKMFKITGSSVDAIRLGKTWKWLTKGTKIRQSNYHERSLKKIIRTDTGEVFENAKEAAFKIFNSSAVNVRKSIKRVCSEVSKNKIRKYRGIRFEFYNDALALAA